MASISPSSGTNLLDLPPEIRVRIYEFAIPHDIVLYTSDSGADIHERVYTFQTSDISLPRFIFSNKLILEETLPIFWDRVALDHSFLAQRDPDIDSTSGDGATETGVGIRSNPKLHVPRDCAQWITKVIIPATKPISPESVWPCTFPSLKAITIAVSPEDVRESDLQRIYIRARSSNRSRSLTAILGEYFSALIQKSSFSDAISLDLSCLLDTHIISIELLPIKVYQRWNIYLEYGVVDDVYHEATALFRYDANYGVPHCEFKDVSEITKRANDRIIRESMFDAVDIPKNSRRSVYRGPEERNRLRRMDLLPRLVCREIEDREMIPLLSAERRADPHQISLMGQY